MLLYMEEEQNMGLHTYAICIVSQGRGREILGNAKIWWKAYQDMLGNRARSLQSKFFFDTQSPFLLLPLLLVMTSLLLLMILLFTTEKRYASETRTFLLNFILGLMDSDVALLQKRVNTKCLSVQLSYLSNVELWEQPIIQSIVQMFIHLSSICVLLTKSTAYD